MTDSSKLAGLIFIPTYNEVDNVESLVHQLEGMGLQFGLLFIDDNSPDGTGELLDSLARTRPNLYVIHRPNKMGVGSAHFDGITWAYRHGYQILVTMDCDFSHKPSYILDFLNYCDSADLVVGSRFLLGKSLEEWNFIRKFLTRLGHFFTRVFLRIPYDSTGAFRLYRLDRISEILFRKVSSKGYSFFFESLFILSLNKYKIKEIPIDLPARTYGESKMTFKDVAKSFFVLWGISLRIMFNPGYYRDFKEE
jgi:dolichol-phosphate mannosyltransferase